MFVGAAPGRAAAVPFGDPLTRKVSSPDARGAVADVVETGWHNLRVGSTTRNRRWRAGGDYAVEQNSTTTEAAPLFAGAIFF